MREQVKKNAEVREQVKKMQRCVNKKNAEVRERKNYHCRIYEVSVLRVERLFEGRPARERRLHGVLAQVLQPPKLPLDDLKSERGGRLSFSLDGARGLLPRARQMRRFGRRVFARS